MYPRRTISAAVATSVLVGLSLAPATAASASAPSAPAENLDSRSLAPTDDSPSIRSLPGNPKLTFYWGLKRNDKRAVARLAAIASPSSGSYRQFLSSRATAKQFGATTKTVRTTRKYLKNRGLRGKLDKSRLFLRVIGRANTMERAFGEIGVEEVAGIVYYGPSKNPKLPKRIKKLVPQPIWKGQKQLSVGTGTDRGVPRRSTEKLQKRSDPL
ncbi:MAG: hypothetical protein HQ526_08945, partial [Actinobacteria bacterium]|nr:hypothetical protein [Actinomycetota bacterium]